MEKIKVSVIMPVLNGMPYFSRALDSVRQQRLRQLEILVVDAGSTDGTREYIMECMIQDSRIHLLNASKKSMGYQYNLGIQSACGEYIGFCESDDYIDENMFHQLYKVAMDNDEPDCVKSDFYMFINKDGKEFSLKYSVLPRNRMDLYGKIVNLADDLDIFWHDNNMWMGIFRRGFLIDNEIRLDETKGAAFQDTSFVQQVNLSAQRQIFITDAYYHYRRDNEGSSVYKKDTSLFFMHELQHMLRYLDTHIEVKKVYGILVVEKLFELFMDFYGKNRYWNKALSFEEDIDKLQVKLKSFCDEMSYAQRTNVLANSMLSVFLCSVELFRQVVDIKYQRHIDQHCQFRQFIQEQSRLVIFGAGENGQSLCALLVNNNYAGEIIFCDNNSELFGKKILGVPVYSVRDASCLFSQDVFVLTNPTYFYAMWRQLLGQGILPMKIIMFPMAGPHSAMEIDWNMMPKKDEN